MSEIGRPLFFSLEDHIKAVEGLIKSDELMLAMEMCDRVLPSYYRANMPKELRDIKLKLYRRIYDNVEYANDWEEAACTREFGEAQADNGYQFPRLNILEALIKELPTPPWIFEVGMSHGNLPLSLIKHGFKFGYHGVALNSKITEKVKSWISNWQEFPNQTQNKILYCSEVLEHASRMEDVVHSAYKIGVDFDTILLSVPLNTLGGGLEDWNRRLGHVRCLNELEFVDFASKHWPGYQWQLTVAPSMVLVGRK